MNSRNPNINQSRDYEKKQVASTIKKSFVAGLFTGILIVLVTLVLFAVGTLRYLEQKAQQTSVFAVAPDQGSNNSRVQLYFPLDKFLSWRSSSKLQLGMVGNEVSIHLNVHPFTQFPVQVAVSIQGVPNVYHGYFMLSQVHGSVDGLPVPTPWLLTAISDEGAQYGVHVSSHKDALYIEKTFGEYRLVGYDAQSQDLIISLPVQTVEHAARGQVAL